MQILIVVVRYKTPLAESQSIKGLASTFASHIKLPEQVGVLIWDNSPMPEVDVRLPFAFTYRHSVQNLGVSGAYNYAIKFAASVGCPWMLLLDQDTTLPAHFLPTMLEYSYQLEGRSEIAAIAPFLMDGERTISPGFLFSHSAKHFEPPFEGIHPGRMCAANSGTLMRVEALQEIGGFNEDFWLDLSDVVVFQLFYDKGKVLYIAGDLRLPHKLAINDYDGSMSPQRYKNFIRAEGAYWDLYRTIPQNTVQTMRLFARAILQFGRFKNKTYSKITLTYALARVFYSRENRLAEWKKQSIHRNIPLISGGRIVG